jgi:hypothetical protein
MRGWRSKWCGWFECGYFIKTRGCGYKGQYNRHWRSQGSEKSSRILPFRKKMRGLSLYRLLLKERINHQTISYVDLLRPDPLLPRMDHRWKSRASTRLAWRKSSWRNEVEY